MTVITISLPSAPDWQEADKWIPAGRAVYRAVVPAAVAMLKIAQKTCSSLTISALHLRTLDYLLYIFVLRSFYCIFKIVCPCTALHLFSLSATAFKQT